jgi:hypothetical protein
VGSQTDAKKQRFGADEALALAREASEIYVAKGKNVTHVDMKKPPADDELLKLLLGPTGNLRAPVVRRGTVLLVGFDAGAYRQVLASKAR